MLHLTLDDVTGTHVADDSGCGNDGIISGNPSSTMGRVGGALEFDGVDDFVRVPRVPSIEPEDFTLRAWIRMDTTIAVYVSKPLRTRLGENSYIIYAVGNQLATVGPMAKGSVSLPHPTLGWHHVAVTKMGSTTKMYLDRPLAGSPATDAVTLYEDEDLFLCADDDDNGDNLPDYFAAGALDDVRLYNRALDDAEIVALP